MDLCMITGVLMVLLLEVLPVSLECTETVTDQDSSVTYCLLADVSGTTTVEAARTCAEKGYFLLSIDSQLESNFLSSLTWWDQYSIRSYWMRLMHQNGYPESWLRWLDCRAPAWTNWDDASPISQVNDSDVCAYVSVMTSHRWRYTSCDDNITNALVCEKEEDNCLVHAHDVSNAYVRHEYCYVTLKSNFTQAQDICKGLGFDLAQFETQNEMMNVFTLFSGKSLICFSNTHYWLSLRSDPDTGIWQWGDGTSVSWSFWQGETPVNTVGCGAALSANDRWVPALCSDNHVFLCERKIGQGPGQSSPPTDAIDATSQASTILNPTTDEITTVAATVSITATEIPVLETSSPAISTSVEQNLIINILSDDGQKSIAPTTVEIEPAITSCSELPDSSHRMISSQQRSVGSVVTLACSPGYHFGQPTNDGASSSVELDIANEFITRCKDDGWWHPTPPNCTAISCPVVPVWNSLIPNTTDRKYRTVVVVTCQSDFRFNQGITQLVSECKEGGNWVPTIPACHKSADYPRHPAKEATYGALFGGIGAFFLLLWIILLLYLDVRLFKMPPDPKMKKKRKRKRILERHRNNRVVPVLYVDTPPPGQELQGSQQQRTVVESMEPESLTDSETKLNDCKNGEIREGKVELVNVPDHPDNTCPSEDTGRERLGRDSSMTALL